MYRRTLENKQMPKFKSQVEKKERKKRKREESYKKGWKKNKTN